MITAHSESCLFLVARFNADGPLGLSFMDEVTISLFSTSFFGVVEAGMPIVLLLQMLRSPGFDNLMLFEADLDNWQIVRMSAGLLVAWFALSSRWLWIGALIASTALGKDRLGVKNLFHHLCLR
jgi:hypothetical protein